MTPDQNPPWNKQDPANKQGGPPAWVGANKEWKPVTGGYKEWNKQDPVEAKQPPPDKSLLLQTELEAAIKADHKKPWREEATYPELQKALAAPEEITGTQMLGAMMIGFAGGYRGDPTAGAKFMKDMIQKREDLAWVKADARSMYEVDPSSLSPEMLRGLAEGTYKDRGSWVAAKSSYRGEVAKAKAKQSDSRTEAFIRESIEGIDPEGLSPTERDQFDWLVATLPEPGTPLTSQEIERMGGRLERIQEGVASREIVVDQLSKLSDEEALNLYSQLADTLPLDELLSVQDAQNIQKVREYLEGKAQDFSHSDVVKGFASAELAQNSSVKRATKDVAASSSDYILKFLDMTESLGLTITQRQATGQEPISESEEAQFLKAKALTDRYIAEDMKKADAVVSAIKEFSQNKDIDPDLWVMTKGAWSSTDPVQQGMLSQLDSIIQEGLRSVSSLGGKELIRQAEALFHAGALGQQQAKGDQKTGDKVVSLMAEGKWSEAKEVIEKLPEDERNRVILRSGQRLTDVAIDLTEANALLANILEEVDGDVDIQEGEEGSLWDELNALIDWDKYVDAKTDPGTQVDPMDYIKERQKFGRLEMQALTTRLEKAKEGAEAKKKFRKDMAAPIYNNLTTKGQAAWDKEMKGTTLEEWADADPVKNIVRWQSAFDKAIKAVVEIKPGQYTEADYEDPDSPAFRELLGMIGTLGRLQTVAKEGKGIPRELATRASSTLGKELRELNLIAGLYKQDKPQRNISVSEIASWIEPENVPRLGGPEGVFIDPTDMGALIPKGFTRDIVDEGQRALMKQVEADANDIGLEAKIRRHENESNTLLHEIELRLSAGNAEGTKELLNSLTHIMLKSGYVFFQGSNIGGEATGGVSPWVTWLPGIDEILEGGEYTDKDEDGLREFVTTSFGLTEEDLSLTNAIALELKSTLQRSLGVDSTMDIDERAYEGFTLDTMDRFQDVVRKSFLENGKFDHVIKTMFGDNPEKVGWGKLDSSEQEAVISHLHEAASSLSASFVAMGEMALYDTQYGPPEKVNLAQKGWGPGEKMQKKGEKGEYKYHTSHLFRKNPLLDAILASHGATDDGDDDEYMVNMMAVMRGLPFSERLDKSNSVPYSLALGYLLRGAHPGDRGPSKSRVKRD